MVREIVPSGATGINDGAPQPDFFLALNFPNPVRTNMVFSFRLDEHALVTLQVFDPLGHLIETVMSESRRAGSHEIRWSAPALVRGIYFYRLQANGKLAVRKMTVVPR